uniref:Uncharacterized protein n=1 Tax=Kalanchoe fedtschenkoi TaxID=63787 RepID=A0A7N0TD56_KALFE
MFGVFRCPFPHMETTCGTLLSELQFSLGTRVQRIWDEIGESDVEKDKMLVELERECLEVYRKKVDSAKRGRAQLRQAIADAEAELEDICSAMRERDIRVRQNGGGSLKEELKTIIPLLEEMRLRRSNRRKQLIEIIEQLQILSEEVRGSTEKKIFLDENDLSLMKLEDLRRQWQELQNEKVHGIHGLLISFPLLTNQLKLVTGFLHTLNSLCMVLGIDYREKIIEMQIGMDGSGGIKGIRSDTVDKLSAAIQSLQALRTQRRQRLIRHQLQEIASAILELWNLMDTPAEEQQKVQNITSKIAVSEEELTEPNILSADFIIYAEAELSKLEDLKLSKMKELVLKKKLELDDVCRKTHIILDECSAVTDLDAGVVDPMFMLESMELQIAKLKEEAFSRKGILEKIEKWFAAREEEAWLEEYNRDDNRYNAGRGAHLSLKRAEKARIMVNKIPAMVEALIVKAKAWNKERGSEFLYDGVSLLSMLEQFDILRQEKDQERLRQRDQKKLLGQLMTEQEALYGSRPSPSKSGKKVPRMSAVGAASTRRATMAVSITHTSRPEKAASQSRINMKFDGDGIPTKKSCMSILKTHENKPAFVRKPFSAASSNRNMVPDEVNKMLDYTPPRALVSSKMPPKSMTPSLKQHFSDAENRTPNIIHYPQQVTPSTLSTTNTYTVMTPTTPRVPSVVRQINTAGNDTEYSFEELRAGFCPS